MAVGTDFPTVALWRDGLIVFIHEDGKKYDARQATILAAEAARIADDVASWTRRVPAYTEVSSWTDATTVELVVHDGDAWRDMGIYGLTREGAPAPVEFEGSGFGSPVAHPEKRPVVPGHFMEAYRALLALRPKTGVAFQPVDIEVMFWGFDYARGEPCRGRKVCPLRRLTPCQQSVSRAIRSRIRLLSSPSTSLRCDACWTWRTPQIRRAGSASMVTSGQSTHSDGSAAKSRSTACFTAVITTMAMGFVSSRKRRTAMWLGRVPTSTKRTTTSSFARRYAINIHALYDCEHPKHVDETAIRDRLAQLVGRTFSEKEVDRIREFYAFPQPSGGPDILRDAKAITAANMAVVIAKFQPPKDVLIVREVH